MPTGTDPDELSTVWFCHMNPDPTHNQCKHPEEEDKDAGTGSYALPSTPATSNTAPKTKSKSDIATTNRDTPASESKTSGPSPAAIAAQAQHTAMLFPCPRLPTVEDVCTKCEAPLVPAGDTAIKVTDEANTIYCHGPCAR
jgi:hypothetical protein